MRRIHVRRDVLVIVAAYILGLAVAEGSLILVNLATAVACGLFVSAVVLVVANLLQHD